jgi:hypothetical protein
LKTRKGSEQEYDKLFLRIRMPACWHGSWQSWFFYNPNPAFAHLRHNPAEYARTLARLVGLAWVVESTSETVTSIDMLQEEAKQLAGEPYSREFQAACEVFASRYREAYR